MDHPDDLDDLDDTEYLTLEFTVLGSPACSYEANALGAALGLNNIDRAGWHARVPTSAIRYRRKDGDGRRRFTTEPRGWRRIAVRQPTLVHGEFRSIRFDRVGDIRSDAPAAWMCIDKGPEVPWVGPQGCGISVLGWSQQPCVWFIGPAIMGLVLDTVHARSVTVCSVEALETLIEELQDPTTATSCIARSTYPIVIHTRDNSAYASVLAEELAAVAPQEPIVRFLRQAPATAFTLHDMDKWRAELLFESRAGIDAIDPGNALTEVEQAAPAIARRSSAARKGAVRPPSRRQQRGTGRGARR